MQITFAAKGSSVLWTAQCTYIHHLPNMIFFFGSDQVVSNQEKLWPLYIGDPCPMQLRYQRLRCSRHLHVCMSITRALVCAWSPPVRAPGGPESSVGMGALLTGVQKAAIDGYSSVWDNIRIPAEWVGAAEDGPTRRW